MSQPTTGNRVLTPPRQAPGSEASTGGAAGSDGAAGAARTRGRAGSQTGQEGETAAAGGPGSLAPAEPAPRQAELMRKSEQIDRMVMRSICTGCEGPVPQRGKKRTPPRVDVPESLTR
jgi:hypothetical protein